MRLACLHNRKSTEVVNKARVLLNVPSANALAYVVHDNLARFEVPIPIVVLPNQHVVLAVANDIDQTGSATSPGNRRCFSIRHPVYPKSATFTSLSGAKDPHCRGLILRYQPQIEYIARRASHQRCGAKSDDQFRILEDDITVVERN